MSKLKPRHQRLNLSNYSCNSYENKLIDECVYRFKNGREKRIIQLRNIESHQLESIANELLNEVAENLTNVSAQSIIPEIFTNSDGIQQLPIPLVEENDEMLEFIRSDNHENLMYKIMEALEIELSESPAESINLNSSSLDEYDMFTEYNFMDIEDSDSTLLCPFCRTRNMEVDEINGIAKCKCDENIRINYGIFGNVFAFKEVLATIFDRFYKQCYRL